jgi:hypothetical protein
LLAWVIELLSRDTNAYCSPSAGHHEVFRLLVCECDEAGRYVSELVEEYITVTVNDANNNNDNINNNGKTHSRAASDTGILLRFRSSCRRWLSSVSRLSFSSAIDCFLLLPLSLLRISYGLDMTAVVVCRQKNERIEEREKRRFAGGAYMKQ